MSFHHLLILGGYGNTGLPLARLLLAHTDAVITLAGRNLEKAQQAAARLEAEYPGNRVHSDRVDAADARVLRRAFDGKGMVIVASSTAQYVDNVARTALEARIDYLDVQYSAGKLRVLQSLADDIRRAGCCFITDGGFHPGLPAAMVRFAAAQFDRLESANISSVIQLDWGGLDLSPSTREEFVREFLDFQTLHFKGGRWQTTSALAMMIPRYVHFGPPFGRRYCLPMFLEEMRSLPAQYPTLRETGFFVGGFNWFVDWFLSPIILVGLKMFPQKGLQPLSRLMLWGLKAFSRPPYGTLLKLEAAGIRKGAPYTAAMTIAHADGYLLTAIPVAACVKQYLDGSIRKPGLWFQAHLVEPARLFRDMRSMGVSIALQGLELEGS